MGSRNGERVGERVGEWSTDDAARPCARMATSRAVESMERRAARPSSLPAMAATIFDSPQALLDAVGQELGTSDWTTVTQEQINLFADATGDHQWIHVDVEKAKAGPFGAPIAHGYLTMSLASMFLPQILQVHGISMGLNYGVDKVRFPSPVPVGSRLRGTGTLVSATEVPGGVQAVTRVTIEREGSDKPAAIVDTVSRYLA